MLNHIYFAIHFYTTRYNKSKNSNRKKMQYLKQGLENKLQYSASGHKNCMCLVCQVNIQIVEKTVGLK